MVKMKDFVNEVQSKLNSISEYLDKNVRFVVTDIAQDYESYIVLKDGNTEYNYTPAIVRVLSPIIPESSVGMYDGVLELTMYGYMDERDDVESIFNFYTANYSGLSYMVGGYQLGINIGGFNITNSVTATEDGYKERGDRFEASVLFNISTSLNVELNKGNEIKVLIDDVEVAYNNLQLSNQKSTLNTAYNSQDNNKLVTDSIVLTLPLTKAKIERYSLIGGEYVLNDDGEYLKTEYNGEYYYYLINTQRYELVGSVYVENENGSYIKILIDEIETYIVPKLILLQDIYGSEKINELFAVGNSGKYNIKNRIKLILPQHEKTADYIYSRFDINVDNQNVPVSFTISYNLAYEVYPVLIDGAMLNVLNFTHSNNGVENVSTEKVGDNIVSKSLIEASVKSFNVRIQHDLSEVSSMLLSEIVNDFSFDTTHTITIKLPIQNGFIEKEYSVILKSGSYNLSENGVITYTADFAERGE